MTRSQSETSSATPPVPKDHRHQRARQRLSQNPEPRATPVPETNASPSRLPCTGKPPIQDPTRPRHPEAPQLKGPSWPVVSRAPLLHCWAPSPIQTLPQPPPEDKSRNSRGKRRPSPEPKRSKQPHCQEPTHSPHRLQGKTTLSTQATRSRAQPSPPNRENKEGRSKV